MTNLPSLQQISKRMPAKLTPEQAIEMAELIYKVEKRSALCVNWIKGTWFNRYNPEDFTNSTGEHVKTREEICKEKGWSYHSVKQAGNIVRIFGETPPDLRYGSDADPPEGVIKWSHFQTAYYDGGVKKAKGWIRVALKRRLNANQLRDFIKDRKISRRKKELDALEEKAKQDMLTKDDIEIAVGLAWGVTPSGKLTKKHYPHIARKILFYNVKDQAVNIRSRGQFYDEKEYKQFERDCKFVNIEMPDDLKKLGTKFRIKKKKKKGKTNIPPKAPTLTKADALHEFGILTGYGLLLTEESFKVLKRYYATKYHPDRNAGKDDTKMKAFNAAADLLLKEGVIINSSGRTVKK